MNTQDLPMTLLHVKHVSKSYHTPILKDVSLTINQGELVCLLGKSGSGKSTLLNIIAHIEQADTGEVISYEQVAYMQQKDLLLPFKTVLENILLPKKIQGTLTKDIKRKAINLLEELGLKGTLHHYPSELSGGMKQRVAFARTIMSEYKLLLLDEPFSALDYITRTDLQKWYASISKKYQLSTLLVTHDIDEALLLADKIMLLDNGTLCSVKILPKDKDMYMLSQQYLMDKKELLMVLTDSFRK
ncbi:MULTISPECIES: ABC transporter ATP-binding protein [unclassified Granulicatella]|uniref:ABC transporter ATP-binding protein n=1 Tax=unclassified Granulicatella TaxID=2630493 RepID=UPI001073F641|nr:MULTISPECIES: ATP-binding cassette domain-containing protein [unclassified Granulicatella]MBF0780031.1 ATP-binding cassette domain-containing protein [Granulicatella sp. 19428wC4_WM01]TFU95880.1 ATP-binding cassette domain-containing protein [Granulicatella sp. WM01]